MLITEILNDPRVSVTATPRAVGTVADFTARTGTIHRRPESRKNLFFAGAHARDGR